MRSVSAAEEQVLAAAVYGVHARVLVEDPDGLLVDLTTAGGTNWVDRVRITEDIDQPVASLHLDLRRETGDVDGPSLAPFDEASPLNRDGLGAFAPLLDLHRQVMVDVATTAPGVAPLAGDWQRIFHGRVDKVDWGTKRSRIPLVARDLGGLLQDTFIEERRTYGSQVGVPIETVMQQILDDNLGAGVVTLHTPAPPGFMVQPYEQELQSIMDALRALAILTGGDVRYLWDDATSSFRLTFYQPERAKVVPDAEFGPSRYLDVRRLSIDKADVRNVVQIEYTDASTGEVDIITRDNPASISRYGRRFMRIREAADSPIDTPLEATAFADAALSDLSDPVADQELELHLWWPAMLGDLIRCLPNGIHYDTAQDIAVVGFTHEIGKGQARTTLRKRGRPAGAFRDWLLRERRVITDPRTHEPPALYTEIATTDLSLTRVRVTLSPEPPVATVHYRAVLGDGSPVNMLLDDGSTVLGWQTSAGAVSFRVSRPAEEPVFVEFFARLAGHAPEPERRVRLDQDTTPSITHLQLVEIDANVLQESVDLDDDVFGWRFWARKGAWPDLAETDIAQAAPAGEPDDRWARSPGLVPRNVTVVKHSVGLGLWGIMARGYDFAGNPGPVVTQKIEIVGQPPPDGAFSGAQVLLIAGGSDHHELRWNHNQAVQDDVLDRFALRISRQIDDGPFAELAAARDPRLEHGGADTEALKGSFREIVDARDPGQGGEYHTYRYLLELLDNDVPVQDATVSISGYYGVLP